MKRILYIGPAPQNIGGISMHIRRLVSLLKGDITPDFVDEGHVRYKGVFNLRSKNIFTYLKKVLQADVVHIHSGVWFLRAFHIMVCKIIFRRQTIVTIHRDPTIEPHCSLTRSLLKKCDHAILVNQIGYDYMKCDCECQYHLLPAFLPPIMEDEPELPMELVNWIEDIRKQKSILMCSNAWNLVMHNGEDLYGLDMCIEAMKMLMDDERNYYLIFVVASNTEQQERMAKYKQMISDYGLEDRILIWESSMSFVRLVQQSDIVLRTTNTDGDAISIREALYFGKPVIASDVVARPDGTTLFRTRDTDDLVKTIKDFDKTVLTLDKEDNKDFRELYLSIYNTK